MFLSTPMLRLATVLGLLVLAAPQSRAGGEGPPDDLLHGRAGGRWELPHGDAPGFAMGVLALPDGTRAFRLRAGLIPMGDAARRGRLRGTVVLPPDHEGDEPETVALVVGHWVRGPEGRGRFEAVLLEPRDRSDEPRRIGRLVGRFHDRGDRPGRFVGRWLLRKD